MRAAAQSAVRVGGEAARGAAARPCRTCSTPTVASARASSPCAPVPAAQGGGLPLHLPARIGDYTDFYAGIHHATNTGRMLRPDNPLLPNYKYMPIAYHGRVSSVVARARPCSGRTASASRARRPCRASGHRAISTTSSSSASGSGRANARLADPDRRGRRAHRRLLPAQRLVGARHPGLGVSAARSVPGQELRHHGLALGGDAGGAGAVSHRAGARGRTAIRVRSIICATHADQTRAPSTSSSRC